MTVQSRRRFLRSSGLLAAAVAVGAATPGCSTTDTTGPPHTDHGSYRPDYVRFAFSGDTAGPGADRFQWQCLQGNMAKPTGVASLFVYATAVRRPSDPTGITQCFPPSDVQESWYLRDRSGGLVIRSGEDIALDVGNSELRARAAEFLIEKCRHQGWTGVLQDEVNSEPQWSFANAHFAAYATPEDYQRAQLGYVQFVGDALRAAGFEFAGNIADPSWPQFCTDLVNTGMLPAIETFVCGRAGPSGYASFEDGSWNLRVDWVAQALTVARRVIVHDTQVQDSAILYGLGSFLLVDNGKGVYGASVDYDADPPFPRCFRDAMLLGEFAGDRTQTAPGVWYRQFSNGRVIVNSTQRPVTVGGRHLGPTSAVIDTT